MCVWIPGDCDVVFIKSVIPDPLVRRCTKAGRPQSERQAEVQGGGVVLAAGVQFLTSPQAGIKIQGAPVPGPADAQHEAVVTGPGRQALPGDSCCGPCPVQAGPQVQ